MCFMRVAWKPESVSVVLGNPTILLMLAENIISQTVKCEVVLSCEHYHSRTNCRCFFLYPSFCLLLARVNGLGRKDAAESIILVKFKFQMDYRLVNPWFKYEPMLNFQIIKTFLFSPSSGYHCHLSSNVDDLSWNSKHAVCFRRTLPRLGACEALLNFLSMNYIVRPSMHISQLCEYGDTELAGIQSRLVPPPLLQMPTCQGLRRAWLGWQSLLCFLAWRR